MYSFVFFVFLFFFQWSFIIHTHTVYYLLPVQNFLVFLSFFFLYVYSLETCSRDVRVWVWSSGGGGEKWVGSRVDVPDVKVWRQPIPPFRKKTKKTKAKKIKPVQIKKIIWASVLRPRHELPSPTQTVQLQKERQRQNPSAASLQEASMPPHCPVSPSPFFQCTIHWKKEKKNIKEEQEEEEKTRSSEASTTTSSSTGLLALDGIRENNKNDGVEGEGWWW